LQLIDKIRGEPFLISQLVRIAMIEISIQPIWEGLATHRWTEAHVTQLDQQLIGFDFLADYQAAMRGENAAQVATMDLLRRKAELLPHLNTPQADSTRGVESLGAHLIPSGWFYQNELCSSEFILERFLPIADVHHGTMCPSLARQATAELTAMRRGPYTLLSKMLLPALDRCPRKFAFAQSGVNLARVACALERYRLARGSYPETLEALGPNYLAKLPSTSLAAGRCITAQRRMGNSFSTR
jgi:hypothetical protein